MSRKSLVPLNVLASSTAPTIPTLVAGDVYFNTSDLTLYSYSGSAWVAAGGSSTTVLYGTFATRPTAGSAGRVYIATDTYSLIGNVGFMWLDTGTTWVKVGLLPQDIYDSINGGVGYALGVDAANHTAALAYTDTKIANEVLDRNVNIANAKNEAVGIAQTYADGIMATEVTNRNAAIATETTNRGTAITSAINTEVTDRNTAISSAISTEVTNRHQQNG